MKKLFITVFFILLTSFFTAHASYSFTYYTENGTACISGILADVPPDTVIIPSKIDGINVTRIENAVSVNDHGDVQFMPFDLKSAKNLVIPEGITHTTFFTGTSKLESVTLPKSIKTLPSFAFSGAKKLKSINLENIERISSMAFDGCVALEEVSLSNCKKIGTHAFNNIHGLTIRNFAGFDSSIYTNPEIKERAESSVDIIINITNNGNSRIFDITEPDSTDSLAVTGTHIYDSDNGEYITVLYALPKTSMSDSQAASHVTVNGLYAQGIRKDMGIYTMYFKTYSAAETAAIKLKNLGLMQGTYTDKTGRTEFELNRNPTRIEAAVMLVRFLGKDAEAQQMKKDHPFTDVPDWANGYITYAYKNGLAKGQSSTVFGSDQAATAQMYITFMLRAAGYSDTAKNPDFTYANPFELAVKCGMITEKTTTFTRGDMAIISYNSLSAKIKNSDSYLYNTLMQNGAFSDSQWKLWGAK